MRQTRQSECAPFLPDYLLVNILPGLSVKLSSQLAVIFWHQPEKCLESRPRRILRLTAAYKLTLIGHPWPRRSDHRPQSRDQNGSLLCVIEGRLEKGKGKDING